jgi:sugar/nucleoside kinase (ribokinase family)
MYSNEGIDLEKMFSEVKLSGVTTSLDMVMVKPNSQAGQANWEKILQRTLPYVDIFIPSIEELMILLHIDPDVTQYLPLEKRISSSQVDFLRRLADRLLGWGAGVVCFKLGKAGMYLRSANQERLAKFGKGAPAKLSDWENREIWSPAFVIDKYCGSTGAGDSAIAGFISALLRKESPERTLMFACGVGACNVEAADALSGLRTWEETTDRIGAGWQRTQPVFEDHQWHMDPSSQCWLSPRDQKIQ